MSKRTRKRRMWLAVVLARLRGKLTPAGWGAFAVFLFTGMIGLDTDSSIAYQAASLLAALLSIAFISSLMFRGRFSVSRRLARFGSVGEPLRYELLLTHEGKGAQSGLMFHENYGDPVEALNETLRPLKPARGRGSFRLMESRVVVPKARFRPAEVAPVMPGDPTCVEAELLPCRRGVLDLREARVARSEPFGLFRSFQPVAGHHTLLILPKRYAVPDLALPGNHQYQLGGVTHSSSVGGAEEFISLRDYQRGDPLRHIHWRSWAKTGEPIVKEFEDEFFVRHGLILDTFCDDTVADEVFEEAVSLAASFACTLGNQESLLDLMFVGNQAYTITAGRGIGRADQLLEVLASAEPSREKSFDVLCALVLAHARDLSGCVVILVMWDEPREKLLLRLRETGMPIRVYLIQEPGSKLLTMPPRGQDPETFRVLEAGRMEQGLRGG